jgi:hypothetical protein
MGVPAVWSVAFGFDEVQLPIAGGAPCSGECHSAFEDLGFEECLHQPVVGFVAQRLVLVVDGGGVFGWV